MIVWGGNSPPDALNTGGRYNPDDDSWTPTGPTGAPTARFDHTAVWSGSETMFRGGFELDGGTTPIPVATGARYCAQPPITPTPTPGPTIPLPIDTLDNQVPIDTVFLKPVDPIFIPNSVTLGSRANFTFDERVVNLSNPSWSLLVLPPPVDHFRQYPGRRWPDPNSTRPGSFDEPDHVPEWIRRAL